MSLARPGPGWDGYGTIGWINSYLTNSKNHFWTTFFGDYYNDQQISFGQHGDPIITLPWRLLWQVLGLFLSADNVYDVEITLLIASNGIAAYLLLRAVALKPRMAFLGSLLIYGLENFDARAMEHVGLLIMAPSLGALLFWWRLANRCQASNLYALAGVTVLGSVSSEYYIFFATVFGLVLFITKRCCSYWLEDASYPYWVALKHSFLAGCMSIVLLLAGYPSVSKNFLNKIMHAEQKNHAGGLAFNRTLEEFEFFTLKNPIAVVAPKMPFLRALMPKAILEDGWLPHMHEAETYELTYHIGFILPWTAVLLLVWYLFYQRSLWSSKKDKRSSDGDLYHKANLQLLLAWIVPSLLMFFFALSSKNWFSLNKVLFYIAPMFRVSLRALIFFDVAVVLLYCFLWQQWLDYLLPSNSILHKEFNHGTKHGKQSKSSKTSKYAMQQDRQQQIKGGLWWLLLILLSIVGHIDGRAGRTGIWFPQTAYAMPEAAKLEALRQLPLPKGYEHGVEGGSNTGSLQPKDDPLLLEIPFMEIGKDRLGYDGLYYADRMWHGLSIFNGFNPLDHIPSALVLGQLFNMPNEATISMLQAQGVDYVFLNHYRHGEQIRFYSYYLEEVAPQTYEVPHTPGKWFHGMAERLGRFCFYPAGILLPVVNQGNQLLPSEDPRRPLSRRVQVVKEKVILALPALELNPGIYGFDIEWQPAEGMEHYSFSEKLFLVQIRNQSGQTLLEENKNFGNMAEDGRYHIHFRLRQPVAQSLTVLLVGLGNFDAVLDSVSCQSLP